jgi:hypothetical protein
MKTFLVTLLLVSALASVALARQTGKPAKQDAHKDHKADAAGEVVKRGTPIGDKSPAVKFADVFKEPQKFAGKAVVIEGVVERVCKAEGCWMQIAPEAGAADTVRVTFDHKFSVPKDADKMKFRAEGEFSVKVLSKEHVEHLVKEDGAKIKTNPDGTANEVSFLATGVELWK